MIIGDLRVRPVVDGVATIAPSRVYQLAHQAAGARGKGPEDADWVPYRDMLLPDGQMEMAVGSFLVETGDRTMLIDAGMGPNPPLPCIGGLLLQRLAALGVQPSDVTDVVFTHLHFDHIGWAATEGTPVFPNASYRCDERDWVHFTRTAPEDKLTDKLAPISTRVATWDHDGSLAQGVDTRHAPGHTPGSTIIVLSSGRDRAMLLGDVVHCPVELVDEEWQGVSDVDPVLAKRTRDALTRELEGGDVPVAAAHFAGMEFGRLLRGEAARRWTVLPS
jgi:glyoxylase-like metal-dependent hydrolase (beta-lactamase superfamily II)